MSISFSSALSRNGKGQISTFDSDNWYLNHQIARAPNRGIFTRQHDSIFENSRITQAIANSSDRVTENILTFARGVNPMVSIQFSNSDGRPSKLPNMILQDGAFRPPIRTQEETMPLSRLPYGPISIDGIPSTIPSDKSRPEQVHFREIITPLAPQHDHNAHAPAEPAPQYISFDRLARKLATYTATAGQSDSTTVVDAVPRTIPVLRDALTTAATSNPSDTTQIVESLLRHIPDLRPSLTAAYDSNPSDVGQIVEAVARRYPELVRQLVATPGTNLSNSTRDPDNISRQLPDLVRMLTSAIATTNPRGLSDDADVTRPIPSLAPALGVYPTTNISSTNEGFDQPRLIPNLDPKLQYTFTTQPLNGQSAGLGSPTFTRLREAPLQLDAIEASKTKPITSVPFMPPNMPPTLSLGSFTPTSGAPGTLADTLLGASENISMGPYKRTRVSRRE